MTPRLGVVLESTMKAPGVVASLLVDSHGSVIETISNGERDLAACGAVASQMLSLWASIGTDLGMGTVDSVLIEWEGGPATITPMGQDAALLVFDRPQLLILSLAVALMPAVQRPRGSLAAGILVAVVSAFVISVLVPLLV